MALNSVHSAKLARTLFRSMIRWSRQDVVVQSRFTLNPLNYQLNFIDHPLENHHEVRSAIYSAFRNRTNNSDNIQLGFETLKHLNHLRGTLTKRMDVRKHNANEAHVSKAIFKIGESVSNTQANKGFVRGVVIGWSIEAESAEQLINVLCDESDLNEALVLSNGFKTRQVWSASKCTSVSDNLLKRVANMDMGKYFSRYDVTINRFIPHDALAFLYPRDFDAELAKGDYKSPSSKQMKELHVAATSVGNTLICLSRQLDEVEKKFADRSALVVEDVLQHTKMMMKTLETFQDFCTAGAFFESSDRSIDDQMAFRTPPPGRRMVVRGSSSGIGYDTSAPEWRTEKSGKLTVMDSTLIVLNTLNSKELKALRSRMDSCYTALYYLTSSYNTIDQLLQLRFQSKGLAYIEFLGTLTEQCDSVVSEIVNSEIPGMDHHSTNHPDSNSNSNSSGDSSSDIDDTAQPRALYAVGQLVKHKRLSLLGVISGFDQRPLQVPAAAAAVDRTLTAATAVGGVPGPNTHQPFYQVFSTSLHSNSVMEIGPNSQYIPQDELLHLTEDEKRAVMVPNGDEELPSVLHAKFDGFDREKKQFIPKKTLEYCFPLVSKGIELEMKNMDSTFQATDEYLLQSYRILSGAFTRSGTVNKVPYHDESAAVFATEHLNLLMKMAPSSDSAVCVEATQWLVNCKHTELEVNKAMRLGLNSSQHGDFNRAVLFYSKAATMAPMFVEAQCRLAVVYYELKQYASCIVYASKALELQPDLCGALSILALAEETVGGRNGRKDALKHIKRVLELNPWSKNMSTIAISIERSIDVETKEMDGKET